MSEMIIGKEYFLFNGLEEVIEEGGDGEGADAAFYWGDGG